MNRWNGKVAVVTRAASDIGVAISKALMKLGLTVVGLSRSREMMEKYMNDAVGPGKFYPKTCDITEEDEAMEALKWVKDNFGSFSILVNNSGYLNIPLIQITSTLRVSFYGLLYISHHAVQYLKDNPGEARIFHINSDLEIRTDGLTKSYSATIFETSRFCVRELIAQENSRLNTNIPVTAIGAAFYETRQKINPIRVEDIVYVIIHILRLPPHIDIPPLIWLGP